jgi:hypothetical protein
VTIIVDTAPIVAMGDRRDSARERVRQLLLRSAEDLVVPAPVSAEIDYLLGVRGGAGARERFLVDLASGAYTVVCLEPREYGQLVDLNRQYSALDLGLADLSVVMLAARFHTLRILTFDYRHFRAVRPLQGGSFVLLPADETQGEA